MPDRIRIILLGSCLGLLLPKPSRGEDTFAYKYEDYREADGRVAVQTQSASLSQDFGTEWEAKLTGTIDAIAGATPSGVPAPAGATEVPTIHMHDRRKAWSADVTRPVSIVTLDAGFAYSRESDYTSYGWSLNTVTEFNEKNTSLTLGAAGTEDYVKVLIPGPPWVRKHGGDGIIGVQQLIDPNTALTLDFTWGRATGFLSDQYKLVQKTVQVFQTIFLPETFAENRPNSRDKGSLVLALNRAFPAWHGAVDASYRFYADTFGIQSHTLDTAWIQRLGDKFILTPSFRFSSQTAANFYYYNLDNSPIIPVRVPNGRGAFYSSDYRLSALNTFKGGLKLTWMPLPALQVDVAFSRYDMRGTDGVTSASAYPRAKITTGGIKYLW